MSVLPNISMSNVIASSSPNANAAVSAFLPVGVLIVGVTVAFLVLGVLIWVFWWGANEIKNHFFGYHGHDLYDASFMHRDTEATSRAIAEHRRFGRLLRPSERNKISRFD